MNVVIGADHGGYEMKEEIKTFLTGLDHDVVDVGCSSTESVDYPDYAEAAVKTIVDGNCDLGILVCGTGIGMSIAANRNIQIRAANCHTEHTAKMSREHNNANILCLGARVIDNELALKIVREWLQTDFAGGRHQQRIDKFSHS